MPLDKYHATLTSPTELAVGVPSCGGDPALDALEEDEEQVRIRIVTTVVVRGESAACNDSLAVALERPLDGRTLIDLVSERSINVRFGMSDSINLAAIPAGATQAAFVDEHPVFVVRDENDDVRVLDAVSAHAPNGFTKVLAWCDTSDGFEDLWHGARFDRNGRWIAGPAPASMAEYLTSRQGDILIVGELQEPPPKVDPENEAVLAVGDACGERTALYLPGHPVDASVTADLTVHEPAVESDGLWYPTEDRILGNVQTHP